MEPSNPINRLTPIQLTKGQERHFVPMGKKLERRPAVIFTNVLDLELPPRVTINPQPERQPRVMSVKKPPVYRPQVLSPRYVPQTVYVQPVVSNLERWFCTTIDRHTIDREVYPSVRKVHYTYEKVKIPYEVEWMNRHGDINTYIRHTRTKIKVEHETFEFSQDDQIIKSCRTHCELFLKIIVLGTADARRAKYWEFFMKFAIISNYPRQELELFLYKYRPAFYGDYRLHRRSLDEWEMRRNLNHSSS